MNSSAETRSSHDEAVILHVRCRFVEAPEFETQLAIFGDTSELVTRLAGARGVEPRTLTAYRSESCDVGTCDFGLSLSVVLNELIGTYSAEATHRMQALGYNIEDNTLTVWVKHGIAPIVPQVPVSVKRVGKADTNTVIPGLNSNNSSESSVPSKRKRFPRSGWAQVSIVWPRDGHGVLYACGGNNLRPD